MLIAVTGSSTEQKSALFFPWCRCIRVDYRKFRKLFEGFFPPVLLCSILSADARVSQDKRGRPMRRLSPVEFLSPKPGPVAIGQISGYIRVQLA